MNRRELVERTQANLRDFQLTAFREIDVIRYINEGIERVVQVIPEFDEMIALEYDTAEPLCLPKPYHHLLAVYASSRLFSQDDRFHQSVSLMNEFESKITTLYDDLISGDRKAYHKDGERILFITNPMYVTDSYGFYS